MAEMQCHNSLGKCLHKPKCWVACAMRVQPRFLDVAAMPAIPKPLPFMKSIAAVIESAGDQQKELKEECEARGALINIVLGLLDAPKGANLVAEVAKLIAERDELREELDRAAASIGKESSE